MVDSREVFDLTDLHVIIRRDGCNICPPYPVWIPWLKGYLRIPSLVEKPRCDGLKVRVKRCENRRISD
jgi:hypothetical protein